MEWHEWYGPDKPPSLQEVSAFVGSCFLEDIRKAIESEFNSAPGLAYSNCSMQKGWNVKYKKSGRALCTLYPMSGYFLALVVLGRREEEKIAPLLPILSQETQALYHKTPFLMGGRWLMLKVEDESSRDDLINLVRLRAAV